MGYEADERGLSAEALDAIERASQYAAAAEPGEECSICMERLDAADIIGGFARMSLCDLTLPCGHRFHGPCFKKWALRHTTCPCCRAGVTDEGVAAMAQSLGQRAKPVALDDESGATARKHAGRSGLSSAGR